MSSAPSQVGQTLHHSEGSSGGQVTPNSLTELLQAVGFNDIAVVESKRVNGDCIEFEIHAEK
jgi:hypothetical protein